MRTNELKTEQQKQIKCISCDEKNYADWFCKNIYEWLCEECNKTHAKTKLLKDHGIFYKTTVKQH